ncbi:MAG: ACP phosphodiesterase [Phycisphaeraceae bacterium]
MNFLAHLHLAEPTPASYIGNLLPDLTSGPTDPELHPEVLAGVLTHRRVDAFTDAHPVFARTRARLTPLAGRFSGILVDLFYDHVLARYWHRYHRVPLTTFIAQAHQALSARPGLMPTGMWPIIARMIRQNWLGCYDTDEGLTTIVGMMSARFSQRLQRPVDLVPAVRHLPSLRSDIDADFHEFYPQLMAFVDRGTPVTESA